MSRRTSIRQRSLCGAAFILAGSVAGIYGSGAVALAAPRPVSPTTVPHSGAATRGSGYGSGSGAPAPTGYWLASSSGAVVAEGSAQMYGPASAPASPVVGMARTATSQGYWLATAAGNVTGYGDAGSFGSIGQLMLVAPVVAIAATPDGQGYWLAASDGGVFAFGDAAFAGSAAGSLAGDSVVGFAATPTGAGYWLATRSGAVIGFGDATLHGSLAGSTPAAPIVGIAATPAGSGYWLAGADGGIYSFGDARFFGSLGGRALGAPITSIAASPGGDGYWLSGADGGAFAFGSAWYYGAPAPAGSGAGYVAIVPLGSYVGGHVLTVGTLDGHAGQFTSIQAAVNAAQPGDWILVAPGDYHESTDETNPPTGDQLDSGDFGGVLVTTPYVHLRGMNRNTVVVDGTKAGANQCSAAAADQNPGYTPANGTPIGRNGIVVWKADHVSIENLTVCNYSTGSRGMGNEIWWNGGADSGQIGMTGYSGDYLTATDSYFGGQSGAQGSYGIFSSNTQGPGVWTQVYANNFSDSGLYIGACQQACDALVNGAWMQNNAIGYSGTNSGGIMTIENSQFDHNKDGFDTNTQSGGDPPPPQNGSCPSGGTSAWTSTHSCWVFVRNSSHDNNNPNVPNQGSASAGPVGTGMTVSGGTDDTVMDNTFANNGAWGTLFVPYPDSTPGGPGVCSGSGGQLVSGSCIYDPAGDALIANTYSNNGFFGNPSNGDFGQVTLFGGEPQNCFGFNIAPDAITPSNLQSAQITCGVPTAAANSGGPLLNQVLCDTGFASSFGVSCTGFNYPASTGVVLTPVPAGLATMANPCQGVPQNSWCPGGSPA